MGPRCTQVKSTPSVVTWILHMVSHSPTCRTWPETSWSFEPACPDELSCVSFLLPLEICLCGFVICAPRCCSCRRQMRISGLYQSIHFPPCFADSLLTPSPSSRISSHKSSPSRVKRNSLAAYSLNVSCRICFLWPTPWCKFFENWFLTFKSWDIFT